MTIFQTERLVIRPWTEDPADLARLFDMYSRPEVMRWLGGGGGSPPLRDPAQAVDSVRGWRDRTAQFGGPYGIWAVELRETGVIVGTTMLKPLPGPDRSQLTGDIEVGWHLHPDSWGHGYATETGRGAIERGLANGLTDLYAVVTPGNDASMAVARRLGMTHVGRRTDWYGGDELETFLLHRPAGPGQPDPHVRGGVD